MVRLSYRNAMILPQPRQQLIAQPCDRGREGGQGEAEAVGEEEGGEQGDRGPHTHAVDLEHHSIGNQLIGRTVPKARAARVSITRLTHKS